MLALLGPHHDHAHGAVSVSDGEFNDAGGARGFTGTRGVVGGPAGISGAASQVAASRGSGIPFSKFAHG